MHLRQEREHCVVFRRQVADTVPCFILAVMNILDKNFYNVELLTDNIR